MKSQVVKRSIVIAGHKTSVSLEDAFWDDLKEIATGKDKTLSDLVADIDSTRQQGNLSSAIRLYVLENVREPRSWRAYRAAPADDTPRAATGSAATLASIEGRHSAGLDRAGARLVRLHDVTSAWPRASAECDGR